MSYNFILLIDDNACWNGGSSLTEQRAQLLDMGMQELPTSGPVNLFVTKETPTLIFSNGSIIIGHLFSNDYKPITNNEIFPIFSKQVEFGEYLLENFWGEYIFIYPNLNSEDELKILRDPSGSVPCIYSIQARFGFITSDISIATKINLYSKNINWNFVKHCLSYPHIKTAHTGLSDINELLPGFSLSLYGNNHIAQIEWSPWNFVKAENRHSDSREAAAEIRKTITSVVQAIANIDKHILLELSGGLDSSIVAFCLKNTGALVNCCTLVTPVPGADERQYAQIMANVLDSTLFTKELNFEAAKFSFTVPSSLVTPRMAVLQYSVSDLMTEVGHLHAVESYFSGGGGDTVFCYIKTAAPAADAFKEEGVMAGIAAVRDLSELHECTFWKALRLTLKKIIQAPQSSYKANSLFIEPSQFVKIPEEHPWFDVPIGALPGDKERIYDLAGTQVFRDSSPRGSKPRRLPLLSQPVMESCLRVPSWMWIQGGRNRAIARQAFSGLLPPEIMNRRSKGTFMGYMGGVYQRNKELMKDFILEGHLQEHNLLDIDALNSFFKSEPSPRDLSFMRIFELCMIENWLRQQS